MSESSMPPEDVAWDDAAVEALLSGASGPADPVAEVLGALRAEGRRLAPDPSPALLELFATGLGRDELTRRRNRSRIVIGMLLAGGTTLGLSGVAAAHDALPSPAQSVVTDIVNGLTPFHITAEDRSPAPAPTDPAPHRRAVEPGDDHGRTADPTPARSETAGAADSGSGHGSGSGGSGSGESGSGGSGSGGSGSGGSGSGESSSGSGSGGSGPDSGSGDGGRTSGSGDSGSGRDGGSGGGGDGGGGSGGSDDLSSGGSGSGGGSHDGGSR